MNQTLRTASHDVHQDRRFYPEQLLCCVNSLRFPTMYGATQRSIEIDSLLLVTARHERRSYRDQCRPCVSYREPPTIEHGLLAQLTEPPVQYTLRHICE